MGSQLQALLNFPLGGDLPSSADAKQKIVDILGIDVLFIENDRQLTQKGDYQTVSGEDNFRLSIYRRLATNPGEYRINPKYGCGCRAAVKGRMRKTDLDELRHRIVENLSRDRRTQKVLLVEVTKQFFGSQTGLRIHIVIQHKGREKRFEPFDFVREAA